MLDGRVLTWHSVKRREKYLCSVKRMAMGGREVKVRKSSKTRKCWLSQTSVFASTT